MSIILKYMNIINETAFQISYLSSQSDGVITAMIFRMAMANVIPPPTIKNCGAATEQLSLY